MKMFNSFKKGLKFDDYQVCEQSQTRNTFNCAQKNTSLSNLRSTDQSSFYSFFLKNDKTIDFIKTLTNQNEFSLKLETSLLEQNK